MRLSSLSLEAFFAVSKKLNFSKAAIELHITQSALSQRILNLEDHLEAKLFIRDPSGIRLTESGHVLLRYCQSQSALEEELLSKILPKQDKNSSEFDGTIRIAGFSSVVRSLVMPRLNDLILKNKKVRIELFVRELHELPGLLKRGQVDFIILDHNLENREIEFKKIGEEENVLIESSKNSVRKNIYLDHDPDDKTTQRFFEIQEKKHQKEFERSYLDDIYGILDGVAMGWGRAVVPLHLIKERKDLRILENYRSLKFPIVLHYYKRPCYSQLFNHTLKYLISN